MKYLIILLISLTLPTTSSAIWWNGWSADTIENPAPIKNAIPARKAIENTQATNTRPAQNSPWGNNANNPQGITMNPKMIHYQQMKKQLAQQRTQLEAMLKNIIVQQQALEASKP